MSKVGHPQPDDDRSTVSHAPFDSSFAHNIYKGRYSKDGLEEWTDTAARVTKAVMNADVHPEALPLPLGMASAATEATFGLIDRRMFIPGGRYLYAAGRDLHQVQNCLLFRAEDTREGWAALAWKAGMGLMTGAGIGVWYGDVRESGALIKRTGGTASGPVPLMKSVNDQGRCYMQGGQRRSAIWAGLPWYHPDVFEFMRAKDWPAWLREEKAKDFNVAAPLDATNISVTLDDQFFEVFENPLSPMHQHARDVYYKVVDKMVTTGEPGFSIDVGPRGAEVLRNACTEITSADDSDICNLGALVLPRFDSPEQFAAAVRHAVLFLTLGTLYSDVPYTAAESPDGRGVDEARTKNRRLGLGIMGGYEFCLQRGLRYGSDDAHEALLPYMREYARALEHAHEWQDKLRISRSVAATAMAPHGTTGIIGETTTSDEPPIAAAYKRRVRNAGANGDTYVTEYVIDPTVKRLLDQGIDASLLEDAHTLAENPALRFSHQAFTQQFVDQSISSTVNIARPLKGDLEKRQFADSLYPYLPQLRGVTVYPEGSRPGQPITPVPLEEAMDRVGVIIEEDESKCEGGVCGI